MPPEIEISLPAPEASTPPVIVAPVSSAHEGESEIVRLARECGELAVRCETLTRENTELRNACESHGERITSLRNDWEAMLVSLSEIRDRLAELEAEESEEIIEEEIPVTVSEEPANVVEGEIASPVVIVPEVAPLAPKAERKKFISIFRD